MYDLGFAKVLFFHLKYLKGYKPTSTSTGQVPQDHFQNQVGWGTWLLFNPSEKMKTHSPCFSERRIYAYFKRSMNEKWMDGWEEDELKEQMVSVDFSSPRSDKQRPSWTIAPTLQQHPIGEVIKIRKTSPKIRQTCWKSPCKRPAHEWLQNSFLSLNKVVLL